MKRKLVFLITSIILFVPIYTKAAAHIDVARAKKVITDFNKGQTEVSFLYNRQLGRHDYLVFANDNEEYYVNKNNFKVTSFRLLNWDYDSDTEIISEEKAVEIAETYLTNHGYIPKDERVLTSNKLFDHGIAQIYTLEFSVLKDGIETTTWEVLDIDAKSGIVTGYLANYDDAIVSTTPLISEEQAKQIAIAQFEKDAGNSDTVILEVRKPDLHIAYDGKGIQVLRYAVRIVSGSNDSEGKAVFGYFINAATGEIIQY